MLHVTTNGIPIIVLRPIYMCANHNLLTMESIKLSPTTTVAMPVTLAKELTANAILAAAMDVRPTVKKKMKNLAALYWKP